MIVKVIKRESNFAQIDNRVLSDNRLSFRARGVLAYCLTKPPSYQIHTEELYTQQQEGRDAIRTAFKELVTFGYAELKQTSNGRQWVIYEDPTHRLETRRWPSPEKPSMGFQGLNNTKEEVIHKPPIVPQGDETDLLGKLTESVDRINQRKEIIAFSIYKAYPVHVAKPKAIAAILKAMKKHPPEFLLERTQLYASVRNGDKHYCCNPTTWFNQERFNDDPSTWKPKENTQPRRLNDDL